MNDFAARILEERTKLQLTQEAFALGCGVKRGAQAAYEAGKRVPDAAYLVSAGRLGVDVKYLLTGVKATDQERERFAIEWLFRELCKQLEVVADVADAALVRAANIDHEPADEFGKGVAMSEIALEVANRSKRLLTTEGRLAIDRDVMQDVIREQEEAWSRTGKAASPVHKSHRIATIYEDAVVTGVINPMLIEGGGVQPLRSRGKKAA